MFGQSQTNHHEGPSRVCLGQSGRTEEACTPLAPCSASNSTFWPSCSSCGITGRNSAVRDFSEPVRAAPKDLGGHAAQTWSKGRRSHPIEDSAPPSAGHAGVSYWPRGRWLGDCSQRDPSAAHAAASRPERGGDQGSRPQYWRLAGMAWITICSPLSKTSTTVSSNRARVSKPSRNSRCGQSSSSRGSIHWHQSAAWIASSGSTPCLSALAWTFTLRSKSGRGGSPPNVTGALARLLHPVPQFPPR